MLMETRLPSGRRSPLPSVWTTNGPVFMPDSSVVSEVVPSANYGDRRNDRMPSLIVLHYTGFADERTAIARLTTTGTETSAHYLVLEDGRVLQLVPESKRAWHAGASSWAGEADVNSISIGIEIVNGGHDRGLPAYPLRQIAAVITLCKGIMIRRNIPRHRVVGHSDIAPGRRQDPGEHFPWQLLADSGVGYCVPQARITPGSTLAVGSTGDDVRALQEGLAQLGYDLPITGQYDFPTLEIVAAFQRHYRPALFDGIADNSTLLTLKRLLAQRAIPSPLAA